MSPPEIPRCEVHLLGRVPFARAWETQRNLSKEIADGIRSPTLLLLEHPHTFTFGRRGDLKNLLWDEKMLKDQGVEIHWIDRGGDVTYHGPGQLVGYPLLRLKPLDQSGRIPQADFTGYLRKLEQTLIRAVAALGIAAAQIGGNTGVWVQPDVASRCPHCPPAAKKTASKLASLGVKVDAAGISQHGFALNVDPDRRFWDGIIACGDPDHPAIALADLLDPSPSMQRVTETVIQAFGRVFGYYMQVATDHLSLGFA